MAPKTCDYEYIIREHLDASTRSSASTPARKREIETLINIAKKSRSLSLPEREQHIKDFCKTMSQLDLEARPRNDELYRGMAPHVGAVWGDKNLGLLENCLKTWGWEAEPFFSKYLQTGWDPLEIPVTGFLEQLDKDNKRRVPTGSKESLRLDPSITKEPKVPPFIAEPEAAEE